MAHCWDSRLASVHWDGTLPGSSFEESCRLAWSWSRAPGTLSGRARGRLGEGVVQYLIIGAGMDSFAFRRPDLLQRIEVFETDHPNEQRKKLRRVRRAGLTVAERHHFVCADLCSDSIVDALAASGLDSTKPTFVSLLGVAYYLTPESLAATARSIAGTLPAGTRMAVDYLLDEASSDPRSRSVRESLVGLVERCGEPMRSSYSLDKMTALMSSSGFEPLETFAVADLNDVYREELGSLLFEIPGIFGMGTFRVVQQSA